MDANFNLRVSDLPILDLGDYLETDGYLDVYYPSNTRKATKAPKKICVQIPYNRRETAEQLRAKIEEKIGMSTEGYYLVSDYGNILDGTTLDEYFPLPRGQKKDFHPLSIEDKPKIEKKDHMLYKSVLYNQYEAEQFEEQMDNFLRESRKIESKNKVIVLMKMEDVRGEYLAQREKILKEREKRRKLKRSNATQSTIISRSDHPSTTKTAGIGKSTHLGTFIGVKR